VWLDKTHENTLVLLQDFVDSIESQSRWATLEKYEVLECNKLVARLTILDEEGEQVSLAKKINNLSTWTWEKYLNAGYLSQQSILKSMFCSLNCLKVTLA